MPLAWGADLSAGNNGCSTDDGIVSATTESNRRPPLTLSRTRVVPHSDSKDPLSATRSERVTCTVLHGFPPQVSPVLRPLHTAAWDGTRRVSLASRRMPNCTKPTTQTSGLCSRFPRKPYFERRVQITWQQGPAFTGNQLQEGAAQAQYTPQVLYSAIFAIAH